MRTSANTSINKNKVPAIFKLVEFEPNTENLDWGGGKYDTATEYLAKKGVKNMILDVYNRSTDHNYEIIQHCGWRMPETATISNVLNVIEGKIDRLNTVFECLKFVRPGGKCYITVYEGDKTGVGKETKPDCWQNNQKLDFYLEELTPDTIKCGYKIERRGKVIIITKGE